MVKEWVSEWMASDSIGTYCDLVVNIVTKPQLQIQVVRMEGTIASLATLRE